MYQWLTVFLSTGAIKFFHDCRNGAKRWCSLPYRYCFLVRLRAWTMRGRQEIVTVSRSDVPSVRNIYRQSRTWNSVTCVLCPVCSQDHEFGYPLWKGSKNPPSRWPELCQSGRAQSPINIKTKEVVRLMKTSNPGIISGKKSKKNNGPRRNMRGIS